MHVNKNCLNESDNIHSMQDFHAILNEYSRPNSAHYNFSLVILDAGMFCDYELLTHRIAHSLASKVTFTYFLGWYDKQKIALLLPDTSVIGAKVLMDMLQAEIIGYTLMPFFSYYSYPSLPES